MSEKYCIGQTIGKLKLLEFVPTSTGVKRKSWKAECECGNTIVLEERNFRRLKTPSCGCGMLRALHKPGDKIGSLTLVRLYTEKKYSNNINVRCWESVCECGKTVKKAESYYNNANNPSCGCANIKLHMEPGQKYNHLTLIEKGNAKTFNLKRKNKSSTMWKCECECGKICYKMADAVFYNIVKSCGCKQVIFGQFGEESKRWLGYKELSKSYYNQLQRNARTRNIEFNVSMKYLYDLFIKQNRKCALTGEELIFSTQHRRDNYKIAMTASVDRIDSSLGYIEGNLQWILWNVNEIKSNLSEEKLLYYCELISKKPWLTIFDNPDLTYEPKIIKRAGVWKGYMEIHGKYLYTLQNGAKKRKIPFNNITLKYLWELYIKQGRRCALTGLEINFRLKGKDTQTASLDRIDSSKPYEEGNVWWVHKDVNKMKMDLTLEEFYKYCMLIYTNTSHSNPTIA